MYELTCVDASTARDTEDIIAHSRIMILHRREGNTLYIRSMYKVAYIVAELSELFPEARYVNDTVLLQKTEFDAGSMCSN